MTDPVLVEVWRGDRVESVHRGSLVVIDAEGATVLSLGDIDRRVFPRSAVKAIQALPLIESGAADAYGFGDRELAMACASHDGEPDHVAAASAMLASAGLDVGALECGTHWPSNHKATLALASAGGAPNDLHNNCSGKHSGFLCTCRHLGFSHRGYVQAGHRAQEIVREAMESVTGEAHSDENRATDGCSIPTYAVPLRCLALGFARMATGRGLGEQRAEAARRLLAACIAKPFFVAGTGRADTELMQAGMGRIFTKAGAEGVQCAAVPELGFGIALKCDDGGERAASVMIAALLSRLLPGDDLAGRLKQFAHPAVFSRKRAPVGSLRPTSALTG